jgi:WD40 repeat protein
MRLLKGHKQTVRQVVYSPDGKRLLSGGEDGLVNLWDLATGAARTLFKGTRNVFAVAFHPNGNLIGLGHAPDVLLFDLKTGAFLPTLCLTHTVMHLSFSADGQYLAASSWEFRGGGGHAGHASCWESVTWNELGKRAHFPRGGVWSLRFAPTGRLLAVGMEAREAGPLRVLAAPDGQEVCRLQQPGVRRLAFSPDGKLLATVVRGSKTATLWDLERGAKCADWRGHTDSALDVAFSPDGKLLLTGSKDGTICFWDVQTRGVRRSFNWQLGEINTVAFAPDGMTAAAGGDRGIMIFDVDGP